MNSEHEVFYSRTGRRGGIVLRKLEVFFDYACPYCRRGHEDLTALLPKHPDIEVVWRPCEAHPRPEVYGT
ncbi:MAG: DsbA family protein, partial [Oscillospiraceae bacterium]|nr:DsbA family protein [Oscillospiraceae bacterium]